MRILITGATGNVGRHLIAHLLALRVEVRALTRQEPAVAGLPPGVEIVRGDLAAPDTLGPAFDGVDRMFLFPVAETAGAVAERARAAGIRRAVVLSSDAVTDGTDTVYHLPVERAMEKSGLEWTHVRPGEFALNKLDTWGRSIREKGVVRAAYPAARGVPVHEADIAAVAAAALTSNDHVGAAYRVTGPQQLTPGEQVAAIATGIGRPLTFIEVSPAEARADLIGLGFPEQIADYLLAFEERWVEHPPQVSPDAERVIGRPTRTLAEWAADHVADF
ncbi:NAD(P)H-binding protein [Micromonospora aurantiaca]|uniref:NAD(P)H-binding protein n=1 Tax=Micromonospora aurantiaca (nom. illeg.) TaxID=47850 RepID=UPI0033C1F95C